MTSRTAFSRFAGRLLPVLAAGVLAPWAAGAQGVGIGTATPDAQAALDISASGKGLLIPRMDSVTRAAITAPPTGLLVFQTDGRQGFWYYGGGTWLWLPDKSHSGDNLGSHSATQDVVLNSTHNLLLRAATDPNHGLGYYGYTDGGPRLWGGTDEADGPVLFGYGGGRLGTTRLGQTSVLAWRTDASGVSRVGIGTSSPDQTLDVRGNANVAGNLYVTASNVLETGAGITSKEYNAGKIGYHFLSADALDITGAGDGSYTTRKINFYSEGGANLFGPLHLTGNVQADGRVAQRTYDPADSGVGSPSGLGVSGGAITLGPNGAGSFTWTHGLGYAPVVVGGLDQTSGGFADYVQWTYSNNGNTSTTFYFTNRSGYTATFRLRWVVVN